MEFIDIFSIIFPMIKTERMYGKRVLIGRSVEITLIKYTCCFKERIVKVSFRKKGHLIWNDLIDTEVYSSFGARIYGNMAAIDWTGNDQTTLSLSLFLSLSLSLSVELIVNGLVENEFYFDVVFVSCRANDLLCYLLCYEKLQVPVEEKSIR